MLGLAELTKFTMVALYAAWPLLWHSSASC
jgi:hypothetical protein